MISVLPAQSAEDFEMVARLCHKLAQWDADAAKPHGISTDDVMTIFHPRKDSHKLAVMFCGPEARMLVARVDGAPVGCLGFEPFDGRAAELAKFFVDTPSRGKGVGRALMAAAIGELDERRRPTILIHTALFMESALTLYRAFGFKPCPRFRDTPEHIKHTDVFLSRPLPFSQRLRAPHSILPRWLSSQKS